MNDFLSRLGIKAQPKAYLNSPMDLDAPDAAPINQVPAEEDPEDSMPAIEEYAGPGPLVSAADQAKINAIPLPQQSPMTQREPAVEDELELGPPSVGPADLETEIQMAAQDSGIDLSQPEETPASPLQTKESLLEQYRNAQKSHQDNLQNLALLQGGNQIAQGFARGFGSNIGAGEEGIKALRDASESKVKGLEGEADMSKKTMSLDEEMKMADPQSDISQFYRQQAYAMLKKLKPDEDFEGQLDNMSAAQLQKIPGMKNMFGGGQKANNRYVTLQNPDGTVVSKVISLDTGETIKDLGLAGYALGNAVDPVTGMPYQNSKSDPNMQYFNKPTPGMGGGQKQSTPNPDGSPAKEEPKKRSTYGDYRATGMISPKEVEGFVNKDKEGFEQQNAPKINIMSGLASVQTLAQEATKNANAASSLGGMVGSLFEPGKLTDEDARRYVEQKGLMNKAQNWVTELASGTITPERAKEIAQTAKVYGDELQKIVRRNAVSYADRTRQGLIKGSEIDPEVLADFYYPEAVLTSNSNLPPVPNGMVRFQDSQGAYHNIPEGNLEAAKKRDPGLKVIKGK